jgi:hypothetical protein
MERKDPLLGTSERETPRVEPNRKRNRPPHAYISIYMNMSEKINDMLILLGKDDPK